MENQLLFLAILGLVPIALATSSGYSVEQTILIVYPDGSVEIKQWLDVYEPPREIVIQLLGRPIYVEIYTGSQSIAPNMSDNKVSILALGNYVNLTYITMDLTMKINKTWVLSYSAPYSTVVILPSGAIPVDVEPKNFEVVYVENSIGLLFPAGNIAIKYIIVPTPLQQTKSVSEVTNQNSTIPLAQVLGYAVPIALGASALMGIAMLRRRSRKLPIALDDIDKRIIETLQRYGEMTARDLVDKLGIPKSTLYRRLNKLKELGLIETRVIHGVTMYRLRGRIELTKR